MAGHPGTRLPRVAQVQDVGGVMCRVCMICRGLSVATQLDTRPPWVSQVQDVGGIVERLLGFLETGRDFVTAEAVIQLKDLLRRYPAIAEASLSSVSSITPEASVCPHSGSLCRNCPACITWAPAPLNSHNVWLQRSAA